MFPQRHKDKKCHNQQHKGNNKGQQDGHISHRQLSHHPNPITRTANLGRSGIVHINQLFLGIGRRAMPFYATRSTGRSLHNSDLKVGTVYVFHNTLMFYSIRHFAKYALQIAANLSIIYELQAFLKLFLCTQTMFFQKKVAPLARKPLFRLFLIRFSAVRARNRPYSTRECHQL